MGEFDRWIVSTIDLVFLEAPPLQLSEEAVEIGLEIQWQDLLFELMPALDDKRFAIGLPRENVAKALIVIQHFHEYLGKECLRRRWSLGYVDFRGERTNRAPAVGHGTAWRLGLLAL